MNEVNDREEECRRLKEELNNQMSKCKKLEETVEVKMDYSECLEVEFMKFFDMIKKHKKWLKASDSRLTEMSSDTLDANSSCCSLDEC